MNRLLRLLGIALALPLTAQEPAARIDLHATARLLGTDVLLRDVAAITTTDPALAERLGAVEVAPRPARGFHRVLQPRDVVERLFAAGFPAQSFAVGGAATIVLEPVFTTLTAKHLHAVADPVLRAALATDPDADVEFEAPSRLETFEAPPGRLGIDLRAHYRPERTTRHSALVEVEIRVDDRVWRTVPIHYRLRRFVRALVTTRPIRRGEPLRDGDVELRRVAATSAVDSRLVDPDAVAGKVAARDLRIDRTLSLADLADPAVVMQNDPVRLVSRRGAIEIVVRAVALEAGAVGDRIRVQNLASGRPIQAIVRAAGLVVVPAAEETP